MNIDKKCTIRHCVFLILRQRFDYISLLFQIIFIIWKIGIKLRFVNGLSYKRTFRDCRRRLTETGECIMRKTEKGAARPLLSIQYISCFAVYHILNADEVFFPEIGKVVYTLFPQ